MNQTKRTAGSIALFLILAVWLISASFIAYYYGKELISTSVSEPIPVERMPLTRIQRDWDCEIAVEEEEPPYSFGLNTFRIVLRCGSGF